MNSRQRIATALDHREPDRIPLDLGGMAQSCIHCRAYQNLRRHLDLPDRESRILNQITRAARMDDDFLERLGIDTLVTYGKWADPEAAEVREEGRYLAYTDEWGVGWHMLADEGYNYAIASHPLIVEAGAVDEEWNGYQWPDPLHPTRFAGLREEAQRARDRGKFVVLMGLCPGIVEVYAWLRGYEQFYLDLGSEPDLVRRFLDKMCELKIAYWLRALDEVGDLVDAINEADDLAAQDSMLWSPEMYRELMKPYHRRIFDRVKAKAPGVKILYHSDGAIRPVIPDLIEIGVDILNPIQLNAAGMDPAGLKRDFGDSLCFWGAGIDVQGILEGASVPEIRDSVKRTIEALAPGGGFIFAPTTILGASEPPEKIMAAWEALQDFGTSG